MAFPDIGAPLTRGDGWNVNQLIKNKTFGNNRLNIGHINMNGMLAKNHFEEFKITIHECHFDIIAILDKSILDNCISIPGFDIFRHDRSTGSHGGVCLFVRKHIKAAPFSSSMTSSLSKI